MAVIYLDNIGMVSFYMRFIWMRLRNRDTARLGQAVPLFRAEFFFSHRFLYKKNN